MFVDGEIRPESELTEEALFEVAKDLGLDTDRFTEGMNSDEVNEQIQANEKLGTDLGAYSTPAFLLAGEPMLGAQPTDVFVDAMDEAVESAQGSRASGMLQAFG